LEIAKCVQLVKESPPPPSRLNSISEGAKETAGLQVIQPPSVWPVGGRVALHDLLLVSGPRD
jgi:hypothetical protein